MQRSFETPGPIRLDLRVPAGRIEVETTETGTTEVLLDAPDELLERAVVDLQGDELRVHVPERTGLFLSFGRDDVVLRVRCPEGSSLQARSASADVEVRGRIQDAFVNSASGDVSVDDASGELSVQTASGDVRIGHAGRLSVNAVSGDVHVREVDGPVNARNVSGDVRLASVSAGDVDVQAVSGDVEVGVRRGALVHVDASTLSGDTRSELDLGDAPVEQEDGPRVDLRIKTVSGNVALVRAPRAAEAAS
jgi:DUF4097 and DUF4098 domain-containing protein YvlB